MAVPDAGDAGDAGTAPTLSAMALRHQKLGDRIRAFHARKRPSPKKPTQGTPALAFTKKPAVMASGLGPASVPASWRVPYWVIDAQDTLGCASDANDCQNNACGGGTSGPCLTYGQIAQRLGTTSPVSQQDTEIEWISTPATPSSDPVSLTPTDNGGEFAWTLQVDEVSGCTGTITNFTPVVRTGGGTLTHVQVGTCLTAAGQIVDNATRGDSVAVTKAVSSGSVWNISQPWNVSAETENTAWANGDSATVYTPQPLYVVQIGGSGFGFVDISTFGSAGPLTVTGTNFVEIDTANLTVGGYGYSDSSIGQETVITSTLLSQGGYAGAIAASAGNAINPFLASGTFLSDDTAITATSGALVEGTDLGLGSFYLGGTAESLQARDNTLVEVANTNNFDRTSSGAFFYGTAEIQVSAKSVFGISGTTAVTTLLNTGGIHVNQFATACSNDRGTPVAVTKCQISVTPANIDLAVGSGGFGGTAYIPGLGTITTGPY
jgi:hypothetical protein